jgi:hypothetical protein
VQKHFVYDVMTYLTHPFVDVASTSSDSVGYDGSDDTGRDGRLGKSENSDQLGRTKKWNESCKSRMQELCWSKA